MSVTVSRTVGTVASIERDRSPLSIAVLAPPWITVPPPGYGGIEAVVALLCDELVARGHEVTLFAAPGSHSPADVQAPLERTHADQIGSSLHESDHVGTAYDTIDAVRCGAGIAHGADTATFALTRRRTGPSPASPHLEAGIRGVPRGAGRESTSWCRLSAASGWSAGRLSAQDEARLDGLAGQVRGERYGEEGRTPNWVSPPPRR
jgi:hypothetical protein